MDEWIDVWESGWMDGWVLSAFLEVLHRRSDSPIRCFNRDLSTRWRSQFSYFFYRKFSNLKF